MNHKEFVRKIIDLYQNARKSKFPNERIKRGRSHTISSSVEDLFALYLLSNIDCDEILVDPPLKIESVNKLFYPDVVVIKDGEIISTYDLKMDMGYIRDSLGILCENAKDNIKKIRGKKCYTKISQEDIIYKECKEYFFSKKLSHNVIIVSGRNIKENKLKAELKNAKKYRPDVKVFVLTGKKHPNEYEYTVKKLIEEIKIKKESFVKIVGR